MSVYVCGCVMYVYRIVIYSITVQDRYYSRILPILLPCSTDIILVYYRYYYRAVPILISYITDLTLITAYSISE